jgi:hypothetical protein
MRNDGSWPRTRFGVRDSAWGSPGRLKPVLQRTGTPIPGVDGALAGVDHGFPFSARHARVHAEVGHALGAQEFFVDQYLTG